MGAQRAAAEPYVTTFETSVTAVDGRTVQLEESYFYAESGGQPADRGRIGQYEVEDVQLRDGRVVHELASAPSLQAGSRVLCSIDWPFRMYCMRAHTASHVLYGAGRRLLDDLGYGGFDIGERRVRVDLETTTEIDDETLVELDRLTNRAIWESRPVTWEELSIDEVRARPNVAFNDKTEDGVLGREETVRVVTVGPATDPDSRTPAPDRWDEAVCGGTHVRNTREIGPATVLDRSNPGEGLTRIELAVGPAAIAHRETEKRVTRRAGTILGVPPAEVPEAIRRLEVEREELSSTVAALRGKLLRRDLEEATPVERDGQRWVVETVDTGDPGDLADVVRDLERPDAAVVVAIGEADRPYVVVGSNGTPGAGAVVDELVEQFGGGGGGSPDLAQAGGFDADAEAIRDYLV